MLRALAAVKVRVGLRVVEMIDGWMEWMDECAF
jgi:hypothetical protein